MGVGDKTGSEGSASGAVGSGGESPGTALVRLRWAKATAEDRRAVSQMLQEARRKKREKRAKRG